MSLYQAVWQTIERTIPTPLPDQSSNKSLVGDSRWVKLLDNCNSTMMLMNPESASLLNIQTNWSDDDKKDSRVGRAVWLAMQESEARSKNEKDGEDSEITDGEIGQYEDSGANSNSSDSSVQRISIDRTALASRSKVLRRITMGNQLSHSAIFNRSQASLLRSTSDGRFVVDGTAPRKTSHVKILPPRESKRVSVIATTEDAPELCSCGLSRYGVSVRPITKMNTKAAKVQHQCIGALSEGIDVQNDDIKEATMITRLRIGGSQKRAEGT